MIKSLITYPLHWLYKGITSGRNLMFDKKILKEFTPPIFSIGVGNLTVGGTGKTPITAYLIDFFKSKNIGVISRGYGRTTTGFFEINAASTPQTVGDEPYMLSKAYPNVKFFVSEDRVKGYERASGEQPHLDLFIFDDVFQHRYIRPHIRLLLTDYHRLFYKDYVLPYGRLRESRTGVSRADAVIVTKCPANISEKHKEEIRLQIQKYLQPHIPIFFSHFISKIPTNYLGETLEIGATVVLVSALANNLKFAKDQAKNYKIKEHFAFRDHHDVPFNTLQKIIEKYPNLPLVTTEKDWVKIQRRIEASQHKRFYVVKIKVEIDDSFSNYLEKQIDLH